LLRAALDENFLDGRFPQYRCDCSRNEQPEAFGLETVLIEDRALGTQLIQDLVSEGMHAIKKYEPTMDKIMRTHSVTSTIENSFVHLPDKAAWLPEYLDELSSFPKGKYETRRFDLSGVGLVQTAMYELRIWSVGVLQAGGRENQSTIHPSQSLRVYRVDVLWEGDNRSLDALGSQRISCLKVIMLVRRRTLAMIVLGPTPPKRPALGVSIPC
jgi:hypothetical protein